jgi:hypothetical protein
MHAAPPSPTCLLLPASSPPMPCILQEALAAAEQKVAELQEQLEAQQRSAAEEASQLQESHAVEVARIALELSNAQVCGYGCLGRGGRGALHWGPCIHSSQGKHAHMAQVQNIMLTAPCGPSSPLQRCHSAASVLCGAFHHSPEP